jgi:hypothetical protein
MRLMHGVVAQADEQRLAVHTNQVERYQAVALVAAATLGAVGGVRLEELLMNRFVVLLMVALALVVAGTVVAKRRYALAQQLIEVPKVAWPDAIIIKQKGTLPAFFAQQLHPQAAPPPSPAFAQVVSFIIGRQPVAIHLLVHPASVSPHLLGRGGTSGLPGGSRRIGARAPPKKLLEKV